MELVQWVSDRWMARDLGDRLTRWVKPANPSQTM
jgi:hypothetical protein